MRRKSIYLPVAALLLAASLPIRAQKFQPKTIQFNGDSEYTNAELLAAAGLKPGIVLTADEIKAHSTQLADSGVFDLMTYKFDGGDLVYTLAPSLTLYPIRLENLPLAAGKDLDAKLHERFPLYHGKVPPEGTLLDGVRGMLAEMLAAEGIKAEVTAMPFGKPGTKQVNAMSFSITAPDVEIGDIQLQGVSPAVAQRVQKVAEHEIKTPYLTERTAANLVHDFALFYTEEGYAAVKVQASQSGAPVVSGDAILIPFSVNIQEGRQYKLGPILLPKDALIAQAEVEKSLSAFAGGPARALTLRSTLLLIASRYRANGYLDCEVIPHPVFDDAAGTVSYTVEINAGPVYHLGLVKFDNVSDELRKLLLHHWEMMPGDVFDDSYPVRFLSLIRTEDPVLQRSLANVKVSYNVTADPQTHDVNCVIKLEK
jgi:outer membrane protein assembly factor BamA